MLPISQKADYNGNIQSSLILVKSLLLHKMVTTADTKEILVSMADTDS